MSPGRTLSIFVMAGALASCGGSTGIDGSGSPGTPAEATPTADVVTLTMGPFTVPPGTEVFKCQDFKNPFGGVDQEIKTYETRMAPGSHHNFLFFSSANRDGALQDCPGGGLEFHPYPFSAQTPYGSLTYPEGVASLVPGSTGFRLNAHYVNAGATPMEGKLTATLHKAAPGTVRQHAGVIFLNDLRLLVPPGESTSKATCAVPGSIHILTASSHMHRRAKAFAARTSEGTLLYETTEWADPIARVFSPALEIPKKTDVTWGCTYQNETARPLTFGESAETNVMCIFTMHYYPVADPKNPTIQCQGL